MDKILSTSTQLSSAEIKDDQDENSLGLHSDAYAQSSQASAAAQKPAIEAVAQQASLPVGNSLLRTSVEIPSLEIVDQKLAPKAAEPARTDTLLRASSFSMTTLNDFPQNLNARTPKSMISEFQTQMHLTQLAIGINLESRKGDVVFNFNPEKVNGLANRLESRPSAMVANILGSTKLEPVARPSASAETRVSNGSEIALLRSQNEKVERVSESKPQDAKLPTLAAPAESKPETGSVVVRTGDVQVSEPQEVITENRDQSSRRNQALEVKPSSLSEQMSPVAQGSFEAGVNQPGRRPASRIADTAPDTISDDNSGPQTERKILSERRPSSGDLFINNVAAAAPGDQKAAAQGVSQQAQLTVGQRLAEATSVVDTERKSSAPDDLGQKIQSLPSTTQTSLNGDGQSPKPNGADLTLPKVENAPVSTEVRGSSEPRSADQPASMPGLQHRSNSPESQSTLPGIIPSVSQQRRQDVDTNSKPQQTDKAPLTGSTTSLETEVGRRLGSSAAQTMAPEASSPEASSRIAMRGADVGSNNSDGVKPYKSNPAATGHTRELIAADAATPKLRSSSPIAGGAVEQLPVAALKSTRSGSLSNNGSPTKVGSEATSIVSNTSQGAKQTLSQAIAPRADIPTRSNSPQDGAFRTTYRAGKVTNSELGLLDNSESGLLRLTEGHVLSAKEAKVRTDKGGNCIEGDQNKGQPKGQGEPTRKGDAVNTPATNLKPAVTERPAEKTAGSEKPAKEQKPVVEQRSVPERPTTTTEKAEPFRPRTEVKPASNAGSPIPSTTTRNGELPKTQSASDKGSPTETSRGPKQADLVNTTAKPAESTSISRPVQAKPAETSSVIQTAVDRPPAVKNHPAPAKQQDRNIDSSLPKPSSNAAGLTERGLVSAAQQLILNGTSDKAPRQSTSPTEKVSGDAARGTLPGIIPSVLNGSSERPPLSRHMSPTAGELITRSLPDYLGNQGHKVGQVGHELAGSVLAMLHRDGKLALPSEPGKPHGDLGKIIPSLLKPISELNLGDQKALPPVKEAPKAVALQQSAKPFDSSAKPVDSIVAPAKADSIKVPTEVTKTATVGDAISGRVADTNKKPQIPVIDASKTPRPDWKSTVKGDAPKAILQENSGTRVNTGVRPVKETSPSGNVDVATAKSPVDRTQPVAKGDGTRTTNADSTSGIKVSAPQEIKGNTTSKADVNGLPRRDAKQVITESPKDIKAIEVKATGIKPVDLAATIKSNSPRAISIDTVNGGRKVEQTTAKGDVRVNRIDSTRIVKGDSVPVVKFDATRVNKIEVARVIKADQPQAHIADRSAKVTVKSEAQATRVDAAAAKAHTVTKADAAVKSDAASRSDSVAKNDSRSIKAEIIRSIKSNVPQLVEQIKVAKSDVAQTVKIDVIGLRKVDAAKVVRSDVSKAVEPKTVKIDSTSVQRPEVANVIKADVVKFNSGSVAEAPRVEVKASTVKADNVVSAAKVETARVIDAKLTGSKPASIDTIQTIKVGVAQIKGEGATSSQIDRLFGKLDNSIKVKADKSLSAHEFINKVSERANLKSADQAKANVKPGDIAVVRVENATRSGDVRKNSGRQNTAVRTDSHDATGKEIRNVDSKNVYAEAKSELRRILKGDKNTAEAKTTESKDAASKDASKAVWPIEGLFIRGRVGAIQVKESEEITSTLKLSQEFEEYLYEDETADYGSDAYFFPGLKAALKFCEVVGLVELEEKLEQKKKADEKQEVKRLSPTRTKYQVQPGDTLQSIAIDKLGDARFADLIVTINRSEVTFRNEDGVRVPLVFAGQWLLLPSEEERSIYQKHYFNAKGGKNGSSSVQISTNEDSATRTARVSAQQRFHSEAMQEQFAPQADSIATRLQRKRLPSESTPIAQTLEKLRFAGNRQSVKWNDVSTGDPISGRESYQVKLGETLQSIAINHPRMGDVRFWLIIAALNDLPSHVDQYGQPIAIIESGQLLVLPTALELIDFCTTGNITGPLRRSRNTGSPGSAGDTVLVPSLAVSICQVQTEKIVDVRNFTPTARMIVSESSTDMDQFSVKLQVVVGYEWKLIASYDSFRGTATRTRYGINGIKATMRLNLPLNVVRQMAVEDFSRNWSFHRDAFQANKPESRERTSGFNLRPVV